MGTSSPTWAHLPLHGHIFPFMGTSSPSWAHLPRHGHILPFMGTSSLTWAHLPLHGHIFPFMGASYPSCHFLADSAYLKLPFWEGLGGKSGPKPF